MLGVWVSRLLLSATRTAILQLPGPGNISELSQVITFPTLKPPEPTTAITKIQIPYHGQQGPAGNDPHQNIKNTGF